ncbi:BRI1 kinase inhibitor 1 [Dendrobium catenatum]|uniref:BRI1 kinase inhibitor 1 n=1 Tax=Dendrobium catenatum TaxID=906689 RepID=A0A2I0WZ92_9ASPA|nr:BRI1 kinase inhibitor 1 [Dendrobium catenatum]
MATENTKKAAKSETAPTSPSAAAESPPWSPPPPRPPPPSPSLSSSPSHEFSFTISFHAPKTFSATTSAAAAAVKLSKSSSSLLDFDLSPADDIFFNGHLLPLHFVSHRPSDISIHNADFHPPGQIGAEYVETSNTAAAAAVSTSDYNGRSLSKSFPLIWLRKWLRGKDGGEDRVEEKQRKKTIKKKVFGFGSLWKKYTSLVESFHFLNYWKEKREIRRSSQFSFSGDGRLRGWHGQGGLSAPPSIRTSPANSGLLGTPPTTNFSSEELQNAIQAAIVHCKNSIAVEDD